MFKEMNSRIRTPTIELHRKVLDANKRCTLTDESSFDDVNKFMEMSANDLEATFSASGVVCPMKIQSNLDESLDRALEKGVQFENGPDEVEVQMPSLNSTFDNKQLMIER